MPAASSRRVLLAASRAEAEALARLFADGPLDGWQARVAHDGTQARFILQHDPFDALLLDEGLYRREGPEGLDWLAAQREMPVVFLAGAVPELVVDVLGRGVEHWLPRDLALAHPRLLVASLDQALRAADQRRRLRAADEALQVCRRQVSRLVNLLWESTLSDAPSPWFTQRHMLERLDEEVARAERQGGPFAVALGDVRPGPSAPDELAAWTASHVQRGKRRADVAGRYGPHGFLLLLVQTPEERAATGCQRLRRELEQAGDVRVHFGVVGWSPAMRTPKALLSCAERRLEAAGA